jgi:hypothetical protein
MLPIVICGDVNKCNCKISDLQNNKIYKILIRIKVLLNSVQISVTDSITYTQDHVVGHLINIFIK